MAMRPTWVFWARGTLISAICGHWVANSLLDPEQYAQAGLAYTWRANLPILVQTLAALAVVLMLGPISKRSGRLERRPPGPSRIGVLALLAASQLVLFLLLEISERIYQREPFLQGLLASGFVFELLFAIGSALLLVCIGSIAIRVIRSVRSHPPASTPSDRISAVQEGISPPHRAVTSVGVRAPPVRAA